MRTILGATLFAGLLAGMAEAVNLASEMTNPDDDALVEIWDEAGCATGDGNSLQLDF